MKTIEEQIKEMEANRDAEIAPIRQALKETMERYYDCQDDYSFGGLADRCREERISEIRRKYEMKIEQLENGGFLERETVTLCLTDLEGKVVSDTLVKGKFGYCFIINGKGETQFVSLAKKQSTYEKKGYRCVTRYRKYKAVFSGKMSQKGNPIYESIEVVDERFEDKIGGEYNIGNYLEWCYENNNLKPQK